MERVQVIRHRRNLGKTEAMVTGADAAESDYVILFDADLQHSPEEFPRFLEKLAEGWDIVTGRKVGRYEKRAVSSVYNALSQKLFEIPVRDLNSMKAFRREILDDVPLRHDWHRFFIVLAHASATPSPRSTSSSSRATPARRSTPAAAGSWSAWATCSWSGST